MVKWKEKLRGLDIHILSTAELYQKFWDARTTNNLSDSKEQLHIWPTLNNYV